MYVICVVWVSSNINILVGYTMFGCNLCLQLKMEMDLAAIAVCLFSYQYYFPNTTFMSRVNFFIHL